MIQLDEASARALLRFGEEVLNIDARAWYSDKYFRQHFQMPQSALDKGRRLPYN